MSMRFPRQRYWRGLPFPSPGDLPDPGIEPVSPSLAADSTTEPPRKSELEELISSSVIASTFEFSLKNLGLRAEVRGR